MEDENCHNTLLKEIYEYVKMNASGWYEALYGLLMTYGLGNFLHNCTKVNPRQICLEFLNTKMECIGNNFTKIQFL